MVTQPTGTVTILFSDLVGSTEAMERAGEGEGQRLLGGLLSRIREVAHAYSGQEVKNLGDGMEVAFTSAIAALDAATAMQRSIEWESHARAFPLSLRIGVNVCEASISDGDYWGLSVVVAKRLCDSADGRQILVSGLVKELVSDRAQWKFRPLGARSLKGISRPIEIFEFLWTPLDHSPTLPLRSGPEQEQKALSRFLRAVRHPEREVR